MSLVVVLLTSQKATAKDVTLSWDPSPTQSVTGYLILIGLDSSLASLHQISPLDVGNVLTHKILGLGDTDEHWFCVKAYDANGNQSVCSNVVKSPAVEVPQEVLPELDLDISVELIK